MKRIKTLKISKVLALFMLMLLFIPSAFAFDSTVKSYIETNGIYSGGKISGLDSAISSKISYSDNGGENVVVNVSGNQVSIYVTAEDQKAIVDIINNKQVAQQNQQAVGDRVSDITSGYDLAADVDTANKLLSGFFPILSTFLGILCVLITLGMTVYSALDIAYIVFPVFQQSCENQKMNGSGPMVKKGGSDKGGLRVSREAQKAVEAAATDDGSNALLMYMKSRIVSYIVLAILLFILLTGNISLITNLALEVVSGIISVLTT